jgi:leucyl-tRNA synthetase
MSKSKGNVVPVDTMADTLGADTGRLFILFIGPPDEDAEWSDLGAKGMLRFLERVWRLYEDRRQAAGSPEGADDRRETADAQPDNERELLRKVHVTIKKVTGDIERFHFNTAVSAIMEMTNAMSAYRTAHGIDSQAYVEAARTLLLLLAPMAPHIAEELWSRAGGEGSIHMQPWPEFNPDLAAAERVTIVVQVNGKVRDRLEMPADVGQDEAIGAALASERVGQYLDGKKPQQVHYVPGRLVSIVV